MKIRFKKEYILIISKKLTYIFGVFSGSPSLAKGIAFYLFIIVKSEDIIEEWLINHELIHFRQQKEMLFVGLFILNLIETLYAKFVLKKTFAEVYKWLSSEQEAYLNHHNKEYLKNRKVWSLFYYIKNKKDFNIGDGGKVFVIK